MARLLRVPSDDITLLEESGGMKHRCFYVGGRNRHELVGVQCEEKRWLVVKGENSAGFLAHSMGRALVTSSA